MSLVLSGCSFRLASSVDELISPVSPQGDDADVQNALSSFVSGGYSLKTPSAGDFTTAYSFLMWTEILPKRLWFSMRLKNSR